MHVCILRHAYFPDDPRDRKQAFALAEAGHMVDILCLKKDGQSFFEEINGIRVYRIPLKHKRKGILRYFIEYALSFLLMSIILLYLFARMRYDCIQVSTLPDFLVFATVIPKALGAKVILDLREPTPELWVTKYGLNRLCWLRKVQTKIEQLGIRYADWALTVTEGLRHRFGDRGANTEKITVIPNVCEEKTFCYERAARKHDFAGKFTLITHGLIEERYGHELVIRAVSKLWDRLPDLQFEILGDGEYRSNLVALVWELKCEDRVHFSGFVSQNELLEKIRGADAGVVAMQRSPYSELVDTNKMYEYMALRKPVIASRLPGVEENFDKSCLMFFEPGNLADLERCIVDLYFNPQKRKQFAENAYSRYEKMRWNVTKQRYIKVMEDLVAETS